MKKKKPRFIPHYRKERSDTAIKHQHWTLEDWKKVVWLDETKINHLGSDSRKQEIGVEKGRRGC